MAIIFKSIYQRLFFLFLYFIYLFVSALIFDLEQIYFFLYSKETVNSICPSTLAPPLRHCDITLAFTSSLSSTSSFSFLSCTSPLTFYLKTPFFFALRLLVTEYAALTDLMCPSSLVGQHLQVLQLSQLL